MAVPGGWVLAHGPSGLRGPEWGHLWSSEGSVPRGLAQVEPTGKVGVLGLWPVEQPPRCPGPLGCPHPCWRPAGLRGETGRARAEGAPSPQRLHIWLLGSGWKCLLLI